LPDPSVERECVGLDAVEKASGGCRTSGCRQVHARPIVEDLGSWLSTQLPKISGKSELAKAIHYALATSDQQAAALRYPAAAA
jgi:Transposase IS66 family